MRRRDTWRGVTRLLVDGTNLLHRVYGKADAGPLRQLLDDLSRHVPPAVDTTVLLDGAAVLGAPTRVQVRPGLTVRYAGRTTADDALVETIVRIAFPELLGVVVVTDDAELRQRAWASGAQAEPLAWLMTRLGGPAQASSLPALGGQASHPATSPSVADPSGDVEEREPWRPGRGATRKRGNPRRGRRPAG